MDYGFIAKNKFEVLKTRNFDTLFEPPPSGYGMALMQKYAFKQNIRYFCTLQLTPEGDLTTQR